MRILYDIDGTVVNDNWWDDSCPELWEQLQESVTSQCIVAEKMSKASILHYPSVAKPEFLTARPEMFRKITTAQLIFNTIHVKNLYMPLTPLRGVLRSIFKAKIINEIDDYVIYIEDEPEIIEFLKNHCLNSDIYNPQEALEKGFLVKPPK